MHLHTILIRYPMRHTRRLCICIMAWELRGRSKRGAGRQLSASLMKWPAGVCAAGLAILMGSSTAQGDENDETIALFKRAGESVVFFTDCYAYAVFPSIGAGGLIIGRAR